MSERYAERPESTPSASSGLEGGISVRDVVTAVQRRWVALLVAFLIVVAFGAWRTLRQPRIYRSAATVRVQQQQAPVAGAQMGPQVYDLRVDPLVSEQQLIRSQKVAEGVVRRLGLRLDVASPPRLSRSALFGAHRPVVAEGAVAGEYRLRLGEADYALSSGSVQYGRVPYGTPLDAGNIRLTVPQRPDVDEPEVILSLSSLSYAAQAVRSGIDTRVLPQTDIIEISYLGTDPPLVRDVTNAVAESYQELAKENQNQYNSSRRKSIRDAIETQSRLLRAAQDSLRYFKEVNQTGDVRAEMSAQAQAIQGLEAERRSLLVEQRIYSTLVNRVPAANDPTDEPLRQLVGTDAVAKNQYVANLYERWFELSNKRSEMEQGVGMSARGVGNAEYRALQQSIEMTKGELLAASRQYLSNITSRIESLGKNIADLRAQGERYPGLEAEQARLEANVSTAQKTFEDLQTEFQLAQIAATADMGSVQIVDSAMTPTFAVAPNRRRAAMVFGMLGLLIGLGLAVLLDKLDNTVKSPEEVQERLDTTVLALIPQIRISDLGDAQDQTALNRLVTHADPRSPVAEAYRSLRTNLAFARADRDLRALVLTSPGPADGKSTTVANLAITFAQQGQRTLLIDADLRRAVMDKTFSVNRSPGLTDVLIGTAALNTAVQETEVPNLHILGSGQFPPNPSELLGSPAMRRTLDEARSQFDIILFDSPPLLAVTDAAVLSTMVDGTILVVRMGSTAREAARRAVTQLRAVHARLLGAVLNDVSAKGASYYGGYGYYYYSYYGTDGSARNGNGNGVIGRLRRLAGRATAGRGRG